MPPPPEIFFETSMRWDAIWCILTHNFEKCYSGILFYLLVVIMFLVIIVSLGREFFMCTNVVASGWCFQYSYLYTVMITIFLGWGGRKLLPLKYLAFCIYKWSGRCVDRLRRRLAFQREGGRKFGRKTAREGEERRDILPFPSHALFALLARPESTCSFLSNACHAGYGIRGNVACERDLLHCMSSLV